MTDAEQFMREYEAIWCEFDTERLAAATMIHPKATIHHSGMTEPVSPAAEVAYVKGIKALMPDISLEVRNWAARDEVIFVEYEISGTLAGRPLSWVGIGRFTLEYDRVIDVIGRWDTRALQAAIDPGFEHSSFAEAAAALVREQAAA